MKTKEIMEYNSATKQVVGVVKTGRSMACTPTGAGKKSNNYAVQQGLKTKKFGS